MDFWKKCSDNSDVCTFGFVMGVLVSLLIVYLYMHYYSSTSTGEFFVNPNAMDPDTKTLLNYQMMRRGYTPSLIKKSEGMCHNKMTHCA
jgi:hypothetical protein